MHALSLVTAQPPEIFCEACGSSVAVAKETAEYCVECGLYTCRTCWSPTHARCRSCVTMMGDRGVRTVGLRMARRADRRLREVVGLERLRLAADEPTEPGDARIEHACLTIKVAAAEHTGLRALRHVREPSPASTRSLTERIHRHALLADAVIEQRAAVLAGIDARGDQADAPVAVVPVARPAGGRRPFAWAIGFVAAGLLLAVVLAPQWLDRLPLGEGPVGEGVLGGNMSGADDDDAAPSGTSDPLPDGTATPPAADTSAPAATLAVAFDMVRMGSGIGVEWLHPPEDGESVTIVANPTPTDRSARLEVIDAMGTEACRVIEPPLTDVVRLSIEAVLDPERPAVGTIQLRNPGGESLLTLRLAESAARLSAGDDGPLSEAGGLEPGRWYAIELIADADGGVLQMAPRDGTSQEMPVEATTFDEVGEVCLRAGGPAGAAVNYDNLLISNE